jgi:hypothetical protein
MAKKPAANTPVPLTPVYNFFSITTEGAQYIAGLLDESKQKDLESFLEKFPFNYELLLTSLQQADQQLFSKFLTHPTIIKYFLKPHLSPWPAFNTVLLKHLKELKDNALKAKTLAVPGVIEHLIGAMPIATQLTAPEHVIPLLTSGHVAAKMAESGYDNFVLSWIEKSDEAQAFDILSTPQLLDKLKSHEKFDKIQARILQGQNHHIKKVFSADMALATFVGSKTICFEDLSKKLDAFADPDMADILSAGSAVGSLLFGPAGYKQWLKARLLRMHKKCTAKVLSAPNCLCEFGRSQESEFGLTLFNKMRPSEVTGILINVGGTDARTFMYCGGKTIDARRLLGRMSDTEIAKIFTRYESRELILREEDATWLSGRISDFDNQTKEKICKNFEGNRFFRYFELTPTDSPKDSFDALRMI